MVKSNVIAFNLCHCFGFIGLHRFYLVRQYTRIGTLLLIAGVIYGFLFGNPLMLIASILALTIWFIVDWLLIVSEKMPDGYGRIVKWNPVLGKSGGFWRRFSALCIDGVIINIISIPIGIILLIAFNDYPQFMQQWNAKNHPVQSLIYIGVAFFYYPIMTALPWQATFGKRCVRVFVGNDDGSRISIIRAFWRHIACAISWLSIIGYPMAAFTKDNRALHDYLANTYVIQGRPEDYDD